MGRGPTNYLLNEAGGHALLTAEEERELSRAYQAGIAAQAKLKRARSPKTIASLQARVAKGEAAKERMISSNIRLVFSTTARYLRKFQVIPNDAVEFEDAVQDGHLGLLRALEDYDPDKGRFSTYATWWIRHFVQRGIDNTGPLIRIPVHMADRRRTVKKVRARIQKERGREKVSVEEVARATGISPKAIAKTDQLPWMVSLDETVFPDHTAGEVERTDVIPDDRVNVEAEALERIWAADLLEAMGKILTPRELKILRLRFEDDFKLREVGEKLDLTRERVRQIQSDAIRKLRKSLKVSGSG